MYIVGKYIWNYVSFHGRDILSRVW